jgi:YVTN family beta-propeller protein
VVKLEETGRISVKGHPVQVGFSHDGRKVFVTLSDMGGVAVIDTGARKVEKTIDTGPGPAQVYVGRDYAFIANQGVKENPGHTVTAIDVHDMTVKGEIPAGKGPHGVNVSADGQMVFITNVYDGTVSVIDGRSFSVVGTIKVGSGPNGITSSR